MHFTAFYKLTKKTWHFFVSWSKLPSDLVMNCPKKLGSFCVLVKIAKKFSDKLIKKLGSLDWIAHETELPDRLFCMITRE